MVAKNNSKLEINDPSFILDKIAFKEKRDMYYYTKAIFRQEQ
jgi:hypothetical protein